MKHLRWALLLLVFFCVPSSLLANTYNWTFTTLPVGNGLGTGVITFQTSDLSSGTFLSAPTLDTPPCAGVGIMNLSWDATSLHLIYSIPFSGCLPLSGFGYTLTNSGAWSPGTFTDMTSLNAPAPYIYESLQITQTQVPEPATLTLMGSGLLAAFARRRLNRR